MSKTLNSLIVSGSVARIREAAKNYIKEFKANHPDITDGNAATRRERHGELLKGLKEALVADPAVVGAKPTDKLLNKWGKLTQGDNESVREYYHRYTRLKDTLAEAEPHSVSSERVNFNRFVGETQSTGLLPHIQYHVKTTGKQTVTEALEAAENFELAHEGVPKKQQTASVRSKPVGTVMGGTTTSGEKQLRSGSRARDPPADLPAILARAELCFRSPKNGPKET